MEANVEGSVEMFETGNSRATDRAEGDEVKKNVELFEHASIVDSVMKCYERENVIRDFDMERSVYR